ncbi:Protein of unknown function [Gryllus bimaculatus]|nr:Protein of unknown function [Gryllus bimaculatus]
MSTAGPEVESACSDRRTTDNERNRAAALRRHSQPTSMTQMVKIFSASVPPTRATSGAAAVLQTRARRRRGAAGIDGRKERREGEAGGETGGAPRQSWGNFLQTPGPARAWASNRSPAADGRGPAPRPVRRDALPAPRLRLRPRLGLDLGFGLRHRGNVAPCGGFSFSASHEITRTIPRDLNGAPTEAPGRARGGAGLELEASGAEEARWREAKRGRRRTATCGAYGTRGRGEGGERTRRRRGREERGKGLEEIVRGRAKREGLRVAKGAHLVRRARPCCWHSRTVVVASASSKPTLLRASRSAIRPCALCATLAVVTHPEKKRVYVLRLSPII